jgi:hypothetical protein
MRKISWLAEQRLASQQVMFLLELGDSGNQEELQSHKRLCKISAVILIENEGLLANPSTASMPVCLSRERYKSRHRIAHCLGRRRSQRVSVLHTK